MTDDEIRGIFLANGFKIATGYTDLKPYVYEAARALLDYAKDRAMKDKFVVTYSDSHQIGPDDWQMQYVSRVFSEDCTMKEVLDWVASLGVHCPNVNHLTFSAYAGESEGTRAEP